jgi:hypothetical protein
MSNTSDTVVMFASIGDREDIFDNPVCTYYYAKINNGNIHAKEYLEGTSEVDYPAIPIYYNCDYNNTEDFLEKGGANQQGVDFFDCGKNNEDKFIVVIYGGRVRIFEPNGNIIFKISTVRKDHEGLEKWVKLLPVKERASFPIADVPTVLAGIGANRHYSSGTFRPIKNRGNILAIKNLLKQEIATPTILSLENALICLSSFELETLVAKIFEEAGCFVPAYRGGNMQGVDLFAFNNTNETIEIAQIVLPPKKRVSIQVKLKSDLKMPPEGVDYLIGIEILQLPQCYGHSWFSEALKSSSVSAGWLRQSLSWLPEKYLEMTTL